jgi:hypothetical protein
LTKNSQKPTVFYIPVNYNAAGTVLGGMFKTRNAIEAVIIAAAICVPLYKFANIPVMQKIIITVIVVLPLVIIALIGINDGSLFQYFGDVFYYLTSKKNIMFFSVFEHEQEELLKKQQKKYKPVKAKKNKKGK